MTLLWSIGCAQGQRKQTLSYSPAGYGGRDTGRLRPEGRSLTFSFTIFDGKGIPFAPASKCRERVGKLYKLEIGFITSAPAFDYMLVKISIVLKY